MPALRITTSTPSNSARTGSELARWVQESGLYPVFVVLGLIVLIGVFVLIMKMKQRD
jgi:hypothetical protein